MAAATPDVIVVSIGATAGWQGADRGLAAALEAVGATVVMAQTGPVPEVRTFMLTDLIQAAAARRAAQRTFHDLRVARDAPGPAIVYCSITAALLWPRPGAIWLDALARENRPGHHGLWQRRVEIRRLAASPMILAMAPSALDSLPAARRPSAVVVPVSVDPSGPPGGTRDIDVVAYVGDPVKRRLDVILEAWGRARHEGETLVVAGLERSGAPAPAGVRFAGPLAPDAFRALLRRACVYAAAPVREDFGITPLQALADGCRLVTTPAPGAYPALALARRLDPRLVSADLATAIRTALDTSDPGYPQRAASLLAPYHTEAVQARLAEDVLPRLLPGWAAA
ncbi:MAG: glycosyltransferase [Actinomycetota bacterium]|nr:glycosyltransferase [Actinomycetota bacterium]